MYTLDDSGAKGMSLLDFPAPAGRVVGDAFDAAVETNPIPLFMQSMELNNARSRGFVMPKEQAAIQAKAAGVDVKVPDTGITQDALGILIERRRDEAARNLLMARSPGGVATAGTLGAGLAGALLDPVNAAAGFIPVLGGTRYAAVLGEAATAGARAGVRLGVGAAEGAVGAAAVEIPTMSLRRDLQDDYSLYDSLANVAFGTFASAGIRGVGGAVRDRVLGLERARQLDAVRAIEPEVWQQLRQRAANEQERAFWGDLEAGFQRGEGIPPELRAAMERERNQPEFDAAMGEYRDARAQIGQLADEAIDRRFQRDRQKMLDAGMEPDEALRQAFAKSYPETEKALKSQAEIGAERLSEAALNDARERIAAGKGLIAVPKNDGEAAAMISEATHAQALKAAVSQAVEGRRIDVAPVTHQDPVFGAQRMGPDAVRDAARTNMSPEQKVGADRQASQRAIEVIKERGRPKDAAANAPKDKPKKTPELAEVEQLLADSRAEHAEFFDALADYKPGPGELLAHGLTKADAADAALVARAHEVNPAKVEALAVQFAKDDAAFMAAVKEIVGDENAKAPEGSQGGEPAKGAGDTGPAVSADAQVRAHATDPEVVRAQQYERAYEALGNCAVGGGL